MKKLPIKALYPFFLIYIILVAVIFFSQRSLMYFPQPGIPDDIAKSFHPNIEIIQVLTDDHLSLKAYFIPPKDISKPILLIFHGNASLALDLVEPMKPIIEDGYGVLFAEYRGYGGNKGSPSEQGIYKDTDAYLDYIHQNFPQSKIVAYGQSLGSAVAVDLVSKNPKSFSGLILEAPFDSALSVADKAYPFIPFKNILLKDKYESDKKITGIKIPKLFLIAGQDDVVGKDTGQKLYELASNPKKIFIYSNAGHNDIFRYGATKDILLFLSEIRYVAINQQIM